MNRIFLLCVLLLPFLIACNQSAPTAVVSAADLTPPFELLEPPSWEATYTPMPTVTPQAVAGLHYESNCGNIYYAEDERSWVNSPDVYAPDEQKVAYSKNDVNEKGIYIFDLATETEVFVPTPLPNFPIGYPAWSPDGRYVAFANYTLSGGGGSIFVVKADGSGLTEVATYQGYYDLVAWSPDGRYIAYTDGTTTHGGSTNVFTTDYKIYMVDYLGREAPVYVANGCAPQWAS